MLHLRWLPHSWCLTLNLIDLYIGKLRRRFKMKERFTSLGTRIVLWNKDNISTVTFKNYFSSDSVVTEWFDYLVHSITKSCFWLKLLSNVIMMPVFNSTTCWGIPDRVWLWRNSGQHLLENDGICTIVNLQVTGKFVLWFFYLQQTNMINS